MTISQPAVEFGSIVPPRDRRLLGKVKEFLADHRDKASLVAPDGASAELPDEVFQIIEKAVDALAEGSAVTVSPVAARLTTSEAAEVLGVSRPTLVKMLDDGKIPYEQLNVHRSLDLADVLAFRDRRRAETRVVLDEMTRQAAADGLYSESHDDYAEART
jgi:excisionase family DNA binding protein